MVVGERGAQRGAWLRESGGRGERARRGTAKGARESVTVCNAWLTVPRHGVTARSWMCACVDVWTEGGGAPKAVYACAACRYAANRVSVRVALR